MDDTNYGKRTVGFSLFSMGFITWLVFLILKCTKVIAWNWFWVWFPLWLPVAIYLALLIVAFIVGLIITILE